MWGAPASPRLDPERVSVASHFMVKVLQSLLERFCSRRATLDDPEGLTGWSEPRDGSYAHLGLADRASGSRPGVESPATSPPPSGSGSRASTARRTRGPEASTRQRGRRGLRPLSSVRRVVTGETGFGAAGKIRVRRMSGDGGGAPRHAPGRDAEGPPIPSWPRATTPRSRRKRRCIRGAGPRRPPGPNGPAEPSKRLLHTSCPGRA